MTEDMFSYEILALVKAFYPEESHVLKMTEPEGEEDFLFLKFTDKEVCVMGRRSGHCLSEQKEEITRTDRRLCKDSVKKAVYRILHESSPVTLPWGTLTGVRPTKLFMELIEQGMTKEEIKAFMQNRYLVTEEKTELGCQIVKTEQELLHKIDYKNSYSIYIGIPFCPTTCLYCSFTSYALKQYSSYVENYLEALFQEIEFVSDCLPDKKLATVYIGGGTPTTLNAGQLEALLKKVKESFDFTHVAEFTVEAGRPDSITKEKLELLKQYGVTRISINPQTMKDETLHIIGRNHSVEDVKRTFLQAREAGHENINMDLIVGLPNETEEDVQKTLEAVMALEPDSITVHSLVLKRAAVLNMQRDSYKEFTFGDVDKMIKLGADFAKEAGMKPYYMYRQKNANGSRNSSRENIGYALEGKEGIYNILIMEEKHTILALGAGASSKFVYPVTGRIQRIENVKNVNEYVERIEEMILRKKSFIEGEYNVSD
jgi:oxygen-independent coproporphyrinogen-3 oxidase